MNPVQRFLAWVFGAIFLALSVVVSVETLARKLFNYSIQGADELGGYALAAGSVIAFSLALVGRNHIRVDVFHERFPHAHAGGAERAVVRAARGRSPCCIAFVAFKVVQRHAGLRQHRPDAVADAADLAAGRLVRGARRVRARHRRLRRARRRCCSSGRIDEVNHHFQPKSVKEEVKEELDDFAQRSGGPALPAPAAEASPPRGSPA